MNPPRLAVGMPQRERLRPVEVPPPAGSPQVQVAPWGVWDGREVRRFTLSSPSGVEIQLSELGASVLSLLAPDASGTLSDIALGYADLKSYATGDDLMGGVAGRCANRIAHGRFTLDGTRYQLDATDRQHHLHGGERGFHRRVWTGELIETVRGVGVCFSRRSPDGEEGYPGALDASVSYMLDDDDRLRIEFEGVTNAPTLCNLISHVYWNLDGHDAGSVAEHELQLAAERFTEADEDGIPNGDLVSVSGTRYDFREPAVLAAAIEHGGLDTNFEVVGMPGEVRPVAELSSRRSGRILRLWADQPGVQVYTAGELSSEPLGKHGEPYQPFAGICLETQRFPNAINLHRWEKPILRPGERYRHRMLLEFAAKRDETATAGPG